MLSVSSMGVDIVMLRDESLRAYRPLTLLYSCYLSLWSLAIAGCGGGSSRWRFIHAAATDPTSTSVIAVDCSRQRGYVPLPNLNSSLHGQVAVLDLAVDPDSKNPLIKIIDIGITALPRSAAADFKTGHGLRSGRQWSHHRNHGAD